MTYQVELTAGAEEDLERLSLTMARRIARMLDRLEENPCGAPAEALRGDLQAFIGCESVTTASSIRQTDKAESSRLRPLLLVHSSTILSCVD